MEVRLGEVLNLEEAAALLGVSTKTLAKALREDALPARKIGREWRFSRATLLQWLGSGVSKDYTLGEAEVKQYFETVANDWEKLREGYFDSSVREKALAKVRLGPGSVVADAGIGTGYVTEALLQTGATVIGIDHSPAMLQQARERFREAGGRVELREGSVQALPLADGAVQALFGNMVLHHAPNPRAAVAEFARVVKPGGWVVLTDLDAHDHAWMAEEMADLWLGFDREEVQEWFEGAGLVDVAVDCTGSDCCAASQSCAGEKAAVSIFLASGRKPRKGGIALPARQAQRGGNKAATATPRSAPARTSTGL